MDRRIFLKTGALAVTAISLKAGISKADNTFPKEGSALPSIAGSGLFTSFSNFKIPKNQNDAFLRKIRSFSDDTVIGLSLKQFVGESTMVNSYPEKFKGILASSGQEGVDQGVMPFNYICLARFKKRDDLLKFEKQNLLQEIISEHSLIKTENGKNLVFDFESTAMTSIGAGNRHKIFRTTDEVLASIMETKVDGSNGTVTVANYVTVREKNVSEFDKRVLELLEVAQQTYQPETSKEGLSGSSLNRYYKKAISTEILKAIKPEGDFRNYVMHGVWESVWDHENSHLDPRFKKAAMKVGSLVVQGPFEPFYKTII